jgi:hypothetical protein
VPLAGELPNWAAVAIDNALAPGRPQRRRDLPTQSAAGVPTADLDLHPDEVLTHLDEITSGLEGYIATCLYAVYDPARYQCRIASATTHGRPLAPRVHTIHATGLPPRAVLPANVPQWSSDGES